MRRKDAGELARRVPARRPLLDQQPAPDAEGAARFYVQLFGWKVDKIRPPGMSSSLFISKLRARDVAAIGLPHRADAPAVPAWDTCIRVNSAQETAQKRAFRADDEFRALADSKRERPLAGREAGRGRRCLSCLPPESHRTRRWGDS
jgi:hypothetical protein